MKLRQNLLFVCTFVILISLVCVGCVTEPSKKDQVPNPSVTALTVPNFVRRAESAYTIRGRQIPDIKIKPNFETEAMDALQFIILCNWVSARAHVTQTFDGDELDLIDPDKLDLKYFADHMPLVDEAEGFIKDLFANRKLEGDRRIQRRVHDKRMKDAIWGAIPNPVAIISGKDWKAIAFVFTQSAISTYMNYRRLQSEEDIRYEQVVWNLDKEELGIVEEFMKQKFRNETAIVGEFQIDGKYILGKDALEELVKQIEQGDSRQLYFYLKNPVTEKKFLLALPYWYYRGITDINEENGDKKDAIDSFYTFQAIHRPIHKHDRMAALVAQNIIMLLDEKDKNEIKRQIQIVIENADFEDWDVRLFAAATLSNVLGRHSEAIAQLDVAISVMERKYREEYSAYMEKLKEESKLRVRDNGKADSKNQVITTIPPSQDILFQLRSARHLISQRLGKMEVKAFVERMLENRFVSPCELLWHLATFEEKYPTATSSFKSTIPERMVSAREIFVDYKTFSGFRSEIPLNWISLAPKAITFDIYSQPNSAETNSSSQDDVDGSSDILQEDHSRGEYYYKGRKTKKPSYILLFEKNGVKANRKDIKTYTLRFTYPGFEIDFDCQDENGETTNDFKGGKFPVKLTIRTKNNRSEHIYEISLPK